MTKIPYIVQGEPRFSPSGELIEIGPSSGSVNGNALTLDQPVPDGLKEAGYHLPANALFDGSEEGWYRVEFSTPTTGTIHEKIVHSLEQ